MWPDETGHGIQYRWKFKKAAHEFPGWIELFQADTGMQMDRVLWKMFISCSNNFNDSQNMRALVYLGPILIFLAFNCLMYIFNGE